MSIKRSLSHDRHGAELSLFLFSCVWADYSFATIAVRQSHVAVALSCHFTVCVAFWLIAIRCKNRGKLHPSQKETRKKKLNAFFSVMSSAQCLLKTRQIMFASDAAFGMLLAAAVHSFCACSMLFCYKSGLFILFFTQVFPKFCFFHFDLLKSIF